jgi:hypothetical protein
MWTVHDLVVHILCEWYIICQPLLVSKVMLSVDSQTNLCNNIIIACSTWIIIHHWHYRGSYNSRSTLAAHSLPLPHKCIQIQHHHLSLMHWYHMYGVLWGSRRITQYKVTTLTSHLSNHTTCGPTDSTCYNPRTVSGLNTRSTHNKNRYNALCSVDGLWHQIGVHYLKKQNTLVHRTLVTELAHYISTLICSIW